MWAGRIPCGKCDIVENEFFVATEFFHINWLPLIPIRTWVIVDGSIDTWGDQVESFEMGWRGVPIRFSIKSLLLAWLRTLIVLSGIAAILYGFVVLMMWLAGRQPIVESFRVVAAIAIAVMLYKASFLFCWANVARAGQLREIIARRSRGV